MMALAGRWPLCVAWVTPLLVVAGCGGATHKQARRRTSPAVAARRCTARPHTGRRLAQRTRARAVHFSQAPDGVALTPDGRTAFIALQSGPPRVAVVDLSGAPRVLREIRVPRPASGMKVTPDGRYVLGAAGSGAVVLNVQAARSGTADALAGVLSAPATVAGTGPGAAEVAISPDSRQAFVTLEGAGRVAVFDLRALAHSAKGAFRGSIAVGSGALGIAVSPDGRWLYTVSEGGRAARGAPEGTLSTIALGDAVRSPSRTRVRAAVAPCAPVRVTASPDGRSVWVTAREGDALLGYSAASLQRGTSGALTSVTRVGPDPLGVSVGDGGQRVLVADSHLSRGRRGRAGVSIVDVRSPLRPRLLGSVPVAGEPDAIAALPSGSELLLTDTRRRRLLLLVPGG